ncbi:MAG TPA: hypothetical protein VGU46_03705 [Acidobacteriaceae bacterium]|nr:hypothetical protein [Acidobacteriaceae bacterium]
MKTIIRAFVVALAVTGFAASTFPAHSSSALNFKNTATPSARPVGPGNGGDPPLCNADAAGSNCTFDS